MGIGQGLKARTLESDRTGYLIFFYLFSLSRFPYRKIGIIIDLPHLMVVRIGLNQIKSLAQCLMHRDHSVNCSQNHDQEVGSEWLCSVTPFSCQGPSLLYGEVFRGAAEAGVWSWRRQILCCQLEGYGETRVLGSALPLFLAGFGVVTSPLRAPCGLRCVN